MKICPFSFLCAILVAASVTSCTQGQIEQVIGNKTQDMISGPCASGLGLLSAAPEFCIYVTELRVAHDTEADVNLTIANRTSRRVYVTIPSRPSLSDSSGTKWGDMKITGIGSFGSGGYPLPLDPNVNSLITMTFRQKGQVVPADLTFSLTGEVMVFKADSKGEMMLQVAPIATRGFQFSGIRQAQQEPPQSSGPTEQNPDTKLAPSVSSGRSTTPKVSAPSQSSAPGAVVGASGSEKLNSPKPASPNTSGSPDQRASTNNTPAGDAPTNNSGLKSVGSSGSGPDVIGLRIGMSPDAARAIFKSHGISYNEMHQTLMFTLSGKLIGESVQNGKYLSSLVASGRETVRAVFTPDPGREGIMSILRVWGSEEVTFNVVEKSLLEKYGAPTLAKANRGEFMWSYDRNGMLKKPGFLKDHRPCGYAQLSIDATGHSEMPSVPLLEKLSAQCGDIFLSMLIIFANKYNGGDTLVKSYIVRMTGFDAAASAGKVAEAIIDKASAEASAAAIKKGQQQQKPQF